MVVVMREVQIQTRPNTFGKRPGVYRRGGDEAVDETSDPQPVRL